MQIAVELHAERKEPDMPSLQVRTMPKDLYDQLAQTARTENRSITQQAIIQLRRSFESVEPAKNRRGHNFAISPDGGARRREALARLAKMHEENPIRIPDDFPSPAEIIREGRDAREEHVFNVSSGRECSCSDCIG
jgi:hypothetical protein